MAAAKGEKWISGAIKHPGALTAKAKRAGALNPDGTIKKAWIQTQTKSDNATTRRQANLAQTLGKMRKGR